MATKELGRLHINPSGWPTMDMGVNRYQLPSHSELVISNSCEVIDSSLAHELDAWNPYNVPWDTKRSSRVSHTPTKQILSTARNENPDIDNRALVQEEEWYCDSGSSSSSTSSNDLSMPRRSGKLQSDDCSSHSDSTWRSRQSVVDDTITQKRKKSAGTKKKSQPSKEATNTRNKISHHQSKDEERVVRTDEIALFMRCKKRPCDVDVQPIPPAPGGWDDIVPERTVNWGEMKSRSNNPEKSRDQSITSKKNDGFQALRDEMHKGSIRNEPIIQQTTRQSSYTKPKSASKATGNNSHSMVNCGKSPTHTPEVSQPWRDKFTTPKSSIKKNGMPCSYYNIPLPTENNIKSGSGQLHPSAHTRFPDMNTGHSYSQIGVASQTRLSSIDTLRHWHFDSDGAYTEKYTNDDSLLTHNNAYWQSKETFSSPWDPQPRPLTTSNPRQNPPVWKDRKGSLDSLCASNPRDLYVPTPSTENSLHPSRNNWSPIPSIWSFGLDETNHVRPPRRSSFDISSTSTIHGFNSVDWPQSTGLDDWTNMNKRVGSLMRLLEEDVAPMPTRANPSIAHEHSDVGCHSSEDHQPIELSSDHFPVAKTPCSHCGASNRVLLPAMRNTYMQ